MRVLRIKLPNHYDKFILKLIKSKQHLKNIILILYNDKNFKKEYKSYLLNFMVMRPIILLTNSNKKSIKLTKYLKKNYNNFYNELISFNKFNDKIIVDIIKELKSNINTAFKNYKNGKINNFKFKPKKLSKIRHGNFVINSNNVKFKNNKIKALIFSRKSNSNNTNFEYIIDNKFNNLNIRNISLQFLYNESYLLITYKEEYDIIFKKSSNYLSIDPGLNNHLSIFITNDSSYLLRNSRINKINNSTVHLLNIINSKIDKTKNNKNKIKRLKYRKEYLLGKRKKILDVEIYRMCHFVLRKCIENNISTVVMGYNKNQKNKVNIGKKNNRGFYNFPHEKVRIILSYLLPQNGIKYVEQEESYTSKLSCLTDKVWKYDLNNKPTESNGLRGIVIKNKKIHSLFKDKKLNLIFHSDINGSINILKKYLEISLSKLKIFLNTKQLCCPILVKAFI